ncbi:large tegument protein [Proboscivirus elephantidbeta5]|uniref:Large tegument protein n=1 Tax=Elephant endotheliotropic herpesvirus 5 TaxID=768738 RepID=A0A075CYC2_9BETA|nr:large tegument protein [Elephant endotheliotropic herpesvirus 5]AHC02780.1 large tegument protein [Elephant endotheliotropic herpesvirus 5]
MIILITGTRNQAHGEFGQRRGSQCMCNCFVFLHACFLKQPEFLNGAHIDDILLHGAILDNQAPVPARPHAYRLPSDIPTHIVSAFGETMHALGTAYGGLAESVNMDGQYYLGLFDFLWRLKQKRRNGQLTLAFVTVNCTTRGLCFKDNLIYLFDPHETTYSEYASILVTDDINEVFQTLYRDRLYFDAAEVFFIPNAQNLTDAEVAMIFSNIPDTSIEIPRPVVVRPIAQRPEGAQGPSSMNAGSLRPSQPSSFTGITHSLSGPFSSVSRSLPNANQTSVGGGVASGNYNATSSSLPNNVNQDTNAPSIDIQTLNLLQAEIDRGTCPSTTISSVSVRQPPSVLCYPHPGCGISPGQHSQNVQARVQTPSRPSSIPIQYPVQDQSGFQASQERRTPSHENVVAGSQPSSLQDFFQAPLSINNNRPTSGNSDADFGPQSLSMIDPVVFDDDSLEPGSAMMVNDEVLATLLPSIDRLEELRVNVMSFLPPPPMPMVVTSDGMQCEVSMLNFRLHHLFCQVIDLGVNNGTGLRTEVEATLRHLQATFEDIQLPDVAKLMEVCIHTKLNARPLYHRVSEYQSTDVTAPYLHILRSKLNAVFQKHRFDTASAIAWVEKHYMHLLQPTVHRDPTPPSNNNLVAFVRQDFKSLSETCQELFERQISQSDQTELLYSRLKRRVTDYNNVRSAVEASNTIETLNSHLQQNAREFIHRFYDETVTSTAEEFAHLLNTSRDNVMAGQMPVQTLKRLLKKSENMKELLKHLKQLNPIKREEYIQRLNDIVQSILFLLNKPHDASRIHDSLRSLKSAYENKQTSVVVHDPRRGDVCVLNAPDMTVSRTRSRTPQGRRTPGNAVSLRPGGEVEPMIQESSNYYVDLFDIEDMDGEDMDVIVTDQTRNALRVQVSNMTLDNLSNISFLENPEFVSMLEDPDFAQMFHAKILFLIDALLFRMASMTRIRETTFFQVRTVVGAVLNNAVKEQFRSVLLFLESLSLHIPVQRMTDTKKILWKLKRYKATWEFLKNRPSAISFYEALSELSDEFTQKGKEDSWTRKARNYTITSHAEAMQFLFSAPSDELRREYEPQIMQKLRIFNENETKARDKQSEKDRKKLSDRRMLIEQNVLHGLETGTHVSGVAQQLCELRGIYSSAPELQLYTDFNQKFTAIILKKKDDVENVLGQAITSNLKKIFHAPRNLVQFRDLVIALDEIKNNGLLTAGNGQLVDDVTADIKLLEDLVRDWVNSEPVFVRSRYRDDYIETKRLEDLVDGLVGPMTTIRNMEERLNDELEGEAAIDGRRFVINTKDLKLLCNTDEIVLGRLYKPFREFLEEKETRKQAELNDKVALTNFNMKSKIETHNMLIQETRKSVPYIIKKHYIKIANVKKMDIEKLSQDPVDFVYNILLPSLSTTPYIETGMIIKWVLELHDLISRFLSDDDNDLMESLKDWMEMEMRSADAKAELEASLAITLDPDRYETILSELDKNRVRGGDKKYRQYEDELKDLKHNKDLFDRSLTNDMKLERLLSNIKDYRFGLDCNAMLIEIQKLEDEFKDTSQTDNKIRLDRLRTYVRCMLQFQRRIVSQQPSVITMDGFVVPVFHQDDMEVQDNLSRLFRRMAYRPTENWYLIENVFGDRDYVDKDLCSSQHKICYRNCILKYYDFYKDDINRDPHADPMMSRTYLAHEVALELGNTIHTFWENILAFPLSRYLQRPLLRRHPHVASLYSMKLCVYAIDFYYSNMSQAPFPLETSVRGTYIRLPQKVFMALMMSFYPNIMLGIVSLPVDVGINSLLNKFSLDNFYQRCNVTTLPAPRQLFTGNNIEAYCIHENQWDTVSPPEMFWNTDLMKEMGGMVSKLTMYILGLLALPTEYLHHVWTQFRPPDLPNISLEEYVSIIFNGIFGQNTESPCQPPSDPVVRNRLGYVQEGVKISRGVDAEDLIKNFQQKCDLFDCVLGSLLFNIPIIAAQRVCRVHEHTILIVNIANFTRSNQDYNNVIEHRNLDFSDLTSKTWSVGNFIEQSWFEAQCQRLRELMTRARSNNPTLVIVDDSKTVFDGYIPRSDRKAQAKLFTSDHIYTDQMHSVTSQGVVEFAFCPTDATFLSEPYDLTSPSAGFDGSGGHIPESVYTNEGGHSADVGQFDLYDVAGMDNTQDAASRRLDNKKRASSYINEYVTRAHATSDRRTRGGDQGTNGGSSQDDDNYGPGGGGSYQPIQVNSLGMPVTLQGSNAPVSMSNALGLNDHAVARARESSGSTIQRQLTRATAALQSLQQDVTHFKDRMLEMLHRVKNVYL